MDTQLVLHGVTHRTSLEKAIRNAACPALSSIDFISHKNLCAIVGLAPSFRFQREARQARRLSSKHNALLDRLMEEIQILPTAGPIGSLSPRAIKSFLQSREYDLCHSLGRYGGLVEMEVTLSWDVSGAVREILIEGAHHETVPAGNALSSNTANALGSELQARRERLTSESLARLQPWLIDHLIEDDGSIGDHLVTLKVLLAETQELGFFDSLRDLRETVGARIGAKCSAMTPARSFAAIIEGEAGLDLFLRQAEANPAGTSRQAA